MWKCLEASTVLSVPINTLSLLTVEGSTVLSIHNAVGLITVLRVLRGLYGNLG